MRTVCRLQPAGREEMEDSWGQASKSKSSFGGAPSPSPGTDNQARGEGGQGGAGEGAVTTGEFTTRAAGFNRKRTDNSLCTDLSPVVNSLGRA